MLTYILEPFKTLLQKNQLDTFEKIWAYEVKWFEEPNERRGGWSGVGRIELAQADGSMLGAFLKKQQNHTRKTWRHPLKGELTFKREFNMLQYLAKSNIGAPRVMCFAQNTIKNQAILMTQELKNHVPLDVYLLRLQQNNAGLLEKNKLIQSLANQIKALHSAQVTHRSLHPKHIFIQEDRQINVAFIDVEKSRLGLFDTKAAKNKRRMIDLGALNRHTYGISRARKLYFLLQYCGLRTLNSESKKLCSALIKRANR